MALNPSGDLPGETTTNTTEENIRPFVVGSKWKFCKRTREGAKVKNNKGEEYPPLDVEVVTINDTDKTCTLKMVSDGKAVTDVKTRQPVQAKFEWLE